MLHNLIDPIYLIKHFGYLGIFIAIFLESGVVIGFFLPGDSLLFAAGLLASQGLLKLPLVMLVAIAAAILGNTVGYLTGRKLGPTLFNRKNSFIFSRKRVDEAHSFFQKQGPQSLVLARFVPAVRCFVPIIAGVANMRYKAFATFNTIGGLLWGIVVPVLGYTLGRTVPNIDHYLLPIILLIAFVSILPVVIPYLKARRHAKVQPDEDLR